MHDSNLSTAGGPKIFEHYRDVERWQAKPDIPLEQWAIEEDRLYGQVGFQPWPKSCEEFWKEYGEAHPPTPTPVPNWNDAQNAHCLSETQAFITAHDRANPNSMILKNSIGLETVAELNYLITHYSEEHPELLNLPNFPECLDNFDRFEHYQRESNWDGKLHAIIEFDGAKLTIKNRDDFSWEETKIDINDTWVLQTHGIEAYHSYSVGIMNFAKSDGTRFNPFGTKILEVTISARTDYGQGYWSGQPE